MFYMQKINKENVIDQDTIGLVVFDQPF